MPKRRPITAGELLRRLNADPQWVAKRKAAKAERAEYQKKAEEDSAELVAAIRSLGFDIDNVWDLVNNAPHPVLDRRFVGPYREAYPVLIEHLRSLHMPGVREEFIRALTVKDVGPELGNALLREFSQETDPEMRWVLANALQTAMPYYRRRKIPEIKEALSWTR